MKYGIGKWYFIPALIIILCLFGFILTRIRGAGESVLPKTGLQPVPVEIADIRRGPIELRRTFSGALESTAEFMVAPKVSGRVEHLAVDLADNVEKGRVVARLDDAEYVQAVTQAKAELAVAKANLAEAGSTIEIADRELKRVRTLRERGVASESKLDAAKTEQLAATAKREVAKAQVIKAEALLETARIRLNYTKVSADWTGGDDHRIVAERLIDEGDTVSANTPLMLIVELDPITGVIFVTEKDYAHLNPGQTVTLYTNAFAGETFEGVISRIAPVFKETSRQARVELTIPNTDHRLKPGMFIRATVVLDEVADAVIVPETALTMRNDRTGVFVVNNDTQTVSWRPVEVGIREQNRVQVSGTGVSGRVVTLGQQLLDDGSPVTFFEKLVSGSPTSGKATAR